MKIILLVFICSYFISTENTLAQNNDSQALLYNIGAKSLIGGIGAILNKKDNQKFSTVFLKGLSQGALGGYLVYESKKMVRQFSRTENYNLLWPSKLLNSAGNSITLNAAKNRNFWERWYLNVGFNHLEYDFKKKRPWSYRIMPYSLIGTIKYSLKGKLDLKNSLYLGNFVFKSDYLKGNAGGAFSNNIIYNYKDSIGPEYLVIAHEIIHTYQYEEWQGFRSYFNKPNTLINIDWKFIKTYNKIFYSDWNYSIQFTKRVMERLLVNPNTRTFTEQEAYYWTDDFLNPFD